MMKKLGFKIANLFFIIISITGLFIPDSFAAHAEFKKMKDLEKKEKPAIAEPSMERPIVEYKAQNLRDPFLSVVADSAQSKEDEKPTLPKATQEPQLPPLVVQGLIWGGSFPQAIINDSVLKIGDIIQGARITSIDKDGVGVIFMEKQYKLSPPGIGANSPKEPQGG